MKCWLLLSISLLGAADAIAQIKDAAIDWQCSQSNPEQRPLPSKTKVTSQFSWRGDQAVINSKAVSDFLNRALGSDFNYYQCNQNFIYQLKLATDAFCETGATPAAKTNCKLSAQKTYNAMNFKNTFALEKQNLIIPGESLIGTVNENDMTTARLGCFLAKEQMSKQYIESSLSSYLKSLDPKCRQRTIESTVKMLASNIAYTCRNQSKAACERMKNATPALMNALNQAQDKPISNLCLQPINIPVEIERLSEAVDQAQRCLPLAQGQTRIVDNMANPNVVNNYAVTRTGGNNFRIDMHIEFSRDDQDVAEEDVTQLKKNMDACLQTVNQKLIGPNGERMQIQVNGTNAPKNIVRNRISLVRSVARESSRKWTPYIDCPTMTHEMMHLLGLVDEYHEKSCGFLVNPTSGKRSDLMEGPPSQLNGNKYVPAFDCRSEGPKNSIMNNHGLAMRETFGGIKEYDKCICTESSPSKCSFLNNLNAKNIYDICQGPGRIFEHYQQLGANTPPPPDSANSKSIVTNRYPEPTKKKSILLPAQFRQIIQPNCRQTNNAFMECSKGSQESSVVGPCPPKPDYCKDPNKWLQ
tara:strand:- start:7592 stop:9340 length:1749 start_codon:yes stop_codon:yes gene_type:complete